jgi:arabinogalactan oligomer/maltooligosaccharide transport system permease protein
MMHFGYTPQFYGLTNSFIAVPYLDSVVWTNYYGPTSWYMQHNDELVAENSETYVTGYGIDGSYYLPYTTDHTLTQNGQTYNIKGYKYAEGNENGGYLASAVSPIIISTGEMIPLTLCGMETDPMNNESGSDFYQIGAGARGAYAYGTKLIPDTATGVTADTIISTVRNLSLMKISAVNIPVYNNQGTTIMPEDGEVKIELFAADLTQGIIYTDSVLGTAYALSRFRFKARTAFMKVNLVIGMFPGFLGMIIMYWVMKEIFHLQGNYLAMVIIYSVGAGGGYYISKGFFDTISKNIDEAAMVDGATKSQIFWQIILPLAKPIIVYTILTSFMGPWGDYVTSSYIIGLQNVENWTVAIGLYQFTVGQDIPQSYYTQFAAGAVVVAVPITTLFFMLQKYYVSGVTGGAVKG